MSDLLQRCSVCGALLDDEDLFCANCGTEAPDDEARSASDESSTLVAHQFLCQGCGASMSYDAGVQALRCPFCGSHGLESRPDSRRLAPSRVIPFSVTENQARETLRTWLGKGFWRPSDLRGRAVLTRIMPVYVPYWLFRAETLTYWTADSSRTPPGARGDWFPVSGSHRGSYDGLLVPASRVLTASETALIAPFDLSQAVKFSEADLTGATVEQFSVPRKFARPVACGMLEALERKACRPQVPGNVRNLTVNCLIQNQASEPWLLPVWVMAYRYRDEVYRFLINGQTGKAAGRAPFSWQKLVWLVLGIVGAVIAAGLIMALAQLLAGR